MHGRTVELRPASWGERAQALVIDGCLWWLPQALWPGWGAWIGGAYLLLRDLWGGAGIGKRVVGIRVVDAAGRPPDWWRHVARNLHLSLPGWGLVSLLFFEGPVAAHAGDGQRLGDRIAATRVVRTGGGE